MQRWSDHGRRERRAGQNRRRSWSKFVCDFNQALNIFQQYYIVCLCVLHMQHTTRAHYLPMLASEKIPAADPIKTYQRKFTLLSF